MALSTVPTFPGSLDAFPLVQPGDTLATNDEEHDLLHNLIVNTIAQIEQKLGIDGAVSSQSIDYIAKHHQHQGSDNSAQLSRLPIRMTASQSLNPIEVSDSGAVVRSAITPAGEFLDIGPTAASLAVRSYVSGDTQDRWQVQADGTIKWGAGGAAVPDTTLARSGIGVLSLTGALAASGTVTGSRGAFGQTGTSGAMLSVLADSTSSIGIITKRFSAASTADLFRATDEVNGVLVCISSAGQLQAAGGSATGPAYAFAGAANLGMYEVAAGVLGFVVPGGGWLSGRRPDATEFFKVQQDGTIVGYNSASFNGTVTNTGDIFAQNGTGNQVRAGVVGGGAAAGVEFSSASNYIGTVASNVVGITAGGTTVARLYSNGELAVGTTQAGGTYRLNVLAPAGSNPPVYLRSTAGSTSDGNYQINFSHTGDPIGGWLMGHEGASSGKLKFAWEAGAGPADKMTLTTGGVLSVNSLAVVAGQPTTGGIQLDSSGAWRSIYTPGTGALATAVIFTQSVGANATPYFDFWKSDGGPTQPGLRVNLNFLESSQVPPSAGLAVMGPVHAQAAPGATVQGAGTVAGAWKFRDNDNHTWEGDGVGGWIFRNAWNSAGATIRFMNGPGGVENFKIVGGPPSGYTASIQVQVNHDAGNQLVQVSLGPNGGAPPAGFRALMVPT